MCLLAITKAVFCAYTKRFDATSTNQKLLCTVQSEPVVVSLNSPKGYSKANLKSNDVKASPCFKPFFVGEDARQIYDSPGTTQVSLNQNCDKRLLASSCLSVCLSARSSVLLCVCPSAWHNSAQTEWIFMKFDVRRFFENLPRNFLLNRCMLVNLIYQRTLRICYRYFFSTATVGMRTRINVTFVSAEPVLLLT